MLAEIDNLKEFRREEDRERKELKEVEEKVKEQKINEERLREEVKSLQGEDNEIDLEGEDIEEIQVSSSRKRVE